MPALSNVERALHPIPRARRAARSRVSIVRPLTVSIETHRPVEFVDVTEALSYAVEDVGLVDGVVCVQTRHTTTGLLINEHEPLLLADLEALFERLVPASLACGHDDFTRRTVNLTPGERRNGPSHLRAALLRTSESVPVVRGRLSLGRWQRVFLVEFDGSQRRELSLTMMGRGT